MTSTSSREGAHGTRPPEREPFSRRVFKLENPANIGPLLHIVLWVGILAAALTVPLAMRWYFAIPLIAVLTLLNFSLTIGVLHMHTHRPLFVSRPMNRLVDILCAMPSTLTGAEMREVHVLNHHRFNDGPGDVTSTEGRDRGLAAVWYWMSYWYIVKRHTMRMVFASDVSEGRRKRRWQFVFDFGLVLALAGVLWFFVGLPFFLFYIIPLLIIQVNSGYFAWLTHAPTRGFEDDPSKSLNTAGNLLNFFIFNQGYHSVHHRYPGVHWSEIPDKMDFMQDVDPKVVVPYWMTLNSAWRLVIPGAFLDGRYGTKWRAKLDRRLEDGTVRSRFLPWFAWI